MSNSSAVVPVVEKFVSINGEGLRAGRLAAFIRTPGCNLSCSWCDTMWANESGCEREYFSVESLVTWVATTPASCVTLTGGEPTLQRGLPALIEALYLSNEWGAADPRVIEIETNGAVDLAELNALRHRLDKSHTLLPTQVAFTVDCKLPTSGMFEYMCDENYACLREGDAVKFVMGSIDDLHCAKRVIDTYDLCSKAQVLFSPVFGQIDPVQIVKFMEDQRLSQVRLQLQLHKIIWPHQDKGV